MPSLNYYVPIHKERRVRVNVCEGEVHITDEVHVGSGMWREHDGPKNLTREQARAVADAINEGLIKGY